MKRYKLSSYDPEEVKKSNSTSRDFSPAFSKPIVPRYIEENIGLNENILDFGAGKNAYHTQKLREKGYNVVAHDFGLNFKEGLHDPAALDKQYSVVFASNVLNTCSSLSGLMLTIDSMVQCVGEGGRLIVNFPLKPRYNDLKGMDIFKILRERFLNVELKNGNKSAPLFECSGKI